MTLKVCFTITGIFNDFNGRVAGVPYAGVTPGYWFGSSGPHWMGMEQSSADRPGLDPPKDRQSRITNGSALLPGVDPQ